MKGINKITIQKTDFMGNELFILREDLIPINFGGNKVRIAYAHIQHMLKHKFTAMIVYGGATSNLVRATAYLCHAFKIPCYVVCPEKKENFLQYNNFLLANFSVKETVFCDKTNVAQTVRNLMDKLLWGGEKPYYIYGNELGKGGEAVSMKPYIQVGKKIKKFQENRRIKFDYLFAPVGTATTFTGLMLGMKDEKLKMIGVSVARDRKKLEETIDEFSQGFARSCNYEIIDKFGGYKNFDNDIIDTIKSAYLELGICLDFVYSARVFRCMKEYILDKGLRNKKIFFVLTGSAPLFFDSLNEERKNLC